MKFNPRARLGLLILLLPILLFENAEANSLTITHYLDYKPYAYVDKDGRSAGMLVDIWLLWAEKSDAKLTFTPARLTRSLELVKKGEADIIIGLFQSAERAAYLDFSSPLMTIDTNLYVEESLNVDSIEALGGIPVGVIGDDYAEGFLSKNYPGLKLKPFPGSKEVINNAVTGKLAAFVLDFQNATYLLSQRNALSKFRRTAKLYTGELRAGVRKGDAQLVNFINQGFKKISRKERKAVYDRWGSYSPELFITRYRYWVIGGTITLLIVLTIIALYSFRLKARVIELAKGKKTADSEEWQAIILRGENDTVEFKSTLRWNLKTGKIDKGLEYVAVKTVSAFLNSEGGSLFIGVADDGELLGIETDYRSFQKKPNRDGFLLKLSGLISQNIGKEYHKFVNVEIRAFEGKDICRIKMDAADKPAFAKKKGNEEFYIRTSAASVPLSLSESHQYITSRW
jgi:ABC-type amino acid transport substrate-binding protein